MFVQVLKDELLNLKRLGLYDGKSFESTHANSVINTDNIVIVNDPSSQSIDIIPITDHTNELNDCKEKDIVDDMTTQGSLDHVITFHIASEMYFISQNLHTYSHLQKQNSYL